MNCKSQTTFAAALFAAFSTAATLTARAADMADEVNPIIGTITQDPSSGHGLGKTFPGATTPCGMVQLSPDTITGGDNGPGYSYKMKTIEGFSFTHLSGIGWYGEFGNLQVMPTTGPRCFDREKACSPYSHDRETAKAGYYQVLLERYGINAEMTAAPRAGILRFTYPAGETRRVQIDLGRRIGQKERWLAHSRQTVKVVAPNAIEGEIVCPDKDGGWGRGAGQVNYTVHYRAEFSEPFAVCGAWEGGSNGIKEEVFADNAGEHAGVNAGFFAEFPASDKPLLMKAGISFVSVEGARKNLAHDIADFDFDAARARSRALWSDAFAGVHVTGGTPAERTIFATALYHALVDPRMVADVDGRYMGSDGKIYQSGVFTLRTVFSGWDVFRSEFPLLTLIRPDIVNDTVNSMMRWMELGPRDTLPVWDIFGCKSSCMLGNPIIPVIVDAYEKGIRNFDAELAWRQADQTSRKRRNNDCGWQPGNLSETLEYAYTDWCMAKFSEMLGKTDDARRYHERALWYKNCWSDEVQWMRARNKDGSWTKWDGRMRHGQGCIESNPWQQGWFVPHDVYGLAELMGGKDKLGDGLNEFFEATPKHFLWNDAYNHANEPVHHVAFMFAYAGRPWLTQKWTREICEKAYFNDVRGLCGNEDVGQMSAWYVLAASGLHPVCPGSGLWMLTSPVFPEISFRLDPKYTKGGRFTVRAHGASKENRYIREAMLNGQPLDRLWLTTQEVSAGGLLEFTMGPEPETQKFNRLPPR